MGHNLVKEAFYNATLCSLAAGGYRSPRQTHTLSLSLSLSLSLYQSNHKIVTGVEDRYPVLATIQISTDITA